MNRVTFRTTLVAVALVGAAAWAFATDDWGPLELQVRSNIVDGYNLPANSSFNSRSPSLADDARVAISLGIVGGNVNTVGLWLGAGGSGSVVWSDAGGPSMSDCSLNAAGVAVFPLTFTVTDGLYFYDAGSGTSGLLTSLPIGSSAWTGAEINAGGQTAFRASFTGQHAWVSYDGEVNPPYHALEIGLVPTSPYWYLYTPSFNNQRLIAGKTSLAADHDADQIILCDVAAVCQVLVEDVDADPTSPYASFANSVSLTNDNRIAFNANLVGGGAGVFLTDGATTVTIATTAEPEISAIDAFPPRANDHGQVVFRAFDGAGLMAIFVGDGGELVRVVTEHDLVPTDLGEGRVDQHDGSVVFGGAPDINNAGDVAFVAALTPADNNQIEWGSGLFIAYDSLIFADGFESGDTGAWSGASR
ncbi:MAG: hypothetical protein PVG53_06750 [Holophagae bacterium]|jgi:hypothetical protein